MRKMENVPVPFSGPVAGEAFRCPDCAGTGSVVLLVTRRKCERCGGTGWVFPASVGDAPRYTSEGPVYTFVWDDESAEAAK